MTLVGEILAIVLLILVRGTFQHPLPMLLASFAPWCVYAAIVYVFARPPALVPSPDSMMRFLLCGLGAAVANGILLVLINLADDGVPQLPPQMIFSFSIGDFTGILMVAPLARTVLAQFGPRREPWRHVLADGLVVLPALVALGLSWLPIRSADLYPLMVALFPLLWLSFRYGWRTAAISLALLSVAVYFLGPGFVGVGPSMQLQLLTSAAGFAALMIGVSGESLRLQSRALTSTIDMLSTRTRALSDAANRLVSKQEEERKRIGAELHDQLGQDMTAIATRLRLVERAQGESDMRQGLRSLGELVADAHEHLRGAIQSLHPLMLDRCGLARPRAAGPMRELARDHGIAYECCIDGDVDALPQDVATASYRICQEATTNGVRHGCGGRVTITLTVEQHIEGRDVTLRIDDDGGSFDLPPANEGLGLQNIYDRADAIGAEHVFRPESGHPRHLMHVRIPV
jgi:two-component system sensor histidine kinase UhpB